MGVLEGKVVLVTGGGNGIGRECALIAAREGAKVVVNDFGGSISGGDEGSAGPAESVAKEIIAAGGQAAFNTDSVTSLKAAKGMVEQALDTFGGLHGVINPAGILRDGMFHKMTEENWDAVVGVHLRGAYNVCRATIEHFRNQEDGAYVLFTSTSGIIGNIGQTNYGAAKMGVAGLSRIIAMEGAAKNVRCNCLAPVAWTRMTQSVPVRDEASAARLKQMAESIRADQPARFSVALLAARSVTGQIFGSSGENIILYSQPRPIQTESKAEGWTVESILSEALPAMQDKFYSLARLPLPPHAYGGELMAGRLDGRSTIVTGAGSGIGRATARLFAQEGARVVCFDRAETVHETARVIESDIGTAVAVTGDAGDEADVKALVDLAVARFGGLDAIYANAGITGRMKPMEEIDAALWMEVLRINLVGPFLAIKHASPIMRAAGKGSIICTASVAGIRSGAGPIPYSASKAGVINLVQTTANLLYGTGVRVNAICPGLIETGMTAPIYRNARERGVGDRIGQLNPLRRGGEPHEIAAAALFLASDDSSYVNGQAIAVDGGLSSSHPVGSRRG